MTSALGRMQLGDGSFSEFHADALANLTIAIKAAIILHTLSNDVDNVIDVEKCKQYVAGGISLAEDLEIMQKIVLFSEHFDLELNRSSIIQFVLSRYNESGAFYEPGGRCRFAMHVGNRRTAYSNSNIISTHLAVDILSKLNALEEINVAKTTAWIVSCKTDNGFKPFPEEVNRNPFDVDDNGTGVPYTYCGVSALKTLGHLGDYVGEADRHNMSSYILQCYNREQGDFDIHRYDWGDLTDRCYSMYATETLHSLGTIEQTEAMNIMRDLVNQLMEDQRLGIHGWPIPEITEYYGLFYDAGGGIIGSFEAVWMLQLTSMLHLLDSTTPRATDTILNLVVVSLLITIVLVAVPCALRWAYYKRKRTDVSTTRVNEAHFSPR